MNEQHAPEYPCQQAGSIRRIEEDVRELRKITGRISTDQTRLLEEVGIDGGNGHTLRGRIENMELAVEKIIENTVAQKNARDAVDTYRTEQKLLEESTKVRFDRKFNLTLGFLGVVLTLLTIWQIVGPIIKPHALSLETTKQAVQEAVSQAMEGALRE